MSGKNTLRKYVVRNDPEGDNVSRVVLLLLDKLKDSKQLP